MNQGELFELAAQINTGRHDAAQAYLKLLMAANTYTLEG